MDSRKDTAKKDETPEVKDYGSLEEVTAATALFAAEDGATKAIPTHHTSPQGP